MFVIRQCSLAAYTRCVGRKLGSKRHTPTPRWQTRTPSSASISMPSGPACPPESWIATPLFDGVPPSMSGRRQICCARVMADLQPVGPAVVLRHEVPLAGRADFEDPAEGDVDAPQVAFAVERRPFEEAVHRGALAVGIGPCGALLAAVFRRQRREAPDFGFSYLLERVEHGNAPQDKGVNQAIQGEVLDQTEE